MNIENDIRWLQRFSNFVKAFTKLEQAVTYIKNDLVKTEELNQKSFIILDEIIKEGLIQRFEYTHELAWNVMKDYFEYQGNTSITGSRDATRESFQKGLIENGEEWMEMIKSRNQSSHTYNQDTATEINNKIKNSYYSLFQLFLIKMESLNQ